MSRLALGEDVASILSSLPEVENQIEAEQQLRLSGWTIAFSKFVLPSLLEWGTVVQSEVEQLLIEGELGVANTPDLVLVSKDNRMRIIDYKTTGIMGKNWVDSWTYSAQLQLNLKSTKERLNWSGPAFIQVIGLDKGMVKEGKLRHPYVYGWVKGGEWLREWKSGAELVSVNEYPGGQAEWISFLGEEVARAQFPFSAPVFELPHIQREVLMSAHIREADIADNISNPKEFIRLFPMNTEECRPAMGIACSYISACHIGGTVQTNQIPAGYKAREPHHQLEVKWKAGEDILRGSK